MTDSSSQSDEKPENSTQINTIHNHFYKQSGDVHAGAGDITKTGFELNEKDEANPDLAKASNFEEDLDSSSTCKSKSKITKLPGSVYHNLMWEVCTRLCDSANYFLPQNQILPLLREFGYQRLNEDFEHRNYKRSRRIQETFSKLISVNVLPHQLVPFFKKQELIAILDYEIRPIFSKYDIQVE